jgi:60S ribosome biogenesis RRP15-like protein
MSSSEERDEMSLDEHASYDDTESLASEEAPSQKHDKILALKKKRMTTLTDAVSTILKKGSAGEGMTKESKILCRRRAPERKLAEAKLDAAARRVLRAERAANQDVAHVTTNLDPNHEKCLRRSATKGVVQIFNVMKQRTHAKEQQEAEKKARKMALLNAAREQQNEPVKSRELGGLQLSFLDLLKTSMTNK